MEEDSGRAPTGQALAVPVEPASGLAPSGFDPSRWIYTYGTPPFCSGLIFALGRYGDVYGPMPCELITHIAWEGSMFHASHDLVAFQRCDSDRNPKGGDSEAAPSRSDESAGPTGIASPEVHND